MKRNFHKNIIKKMNNKTTINKININNKSILLNIDSVLSGNNL